MTSARRPDAPGDRAERREGRIYFRATDTERWLLEQAAEATGKTLTAFVLDAASREAERALVDRRLFLLDADQWEQFKEALDRPATDRPRLRSLLQAPTTSD